MPNEFKADVGTGGLSTVAIELFSGDLTQIYNSATPGFEAYNGSHLASYELAATELPAGSSSGVYAASMPSGIAAGQYFFRAVSTAGGGELTSLAALDWNGSAEAHAGNATVGGYTAGEDPASLLAASLAALEAYGDTRWATSADPWQTALPGNYAGGTAGNILGSALNDLLAADRWIDTSVSPWAFVLIRKGTGPLGTGTELLRQTLYDVTGNPLLAASTVIGRAIG